MPNERKTEELVRGWLRNHGYYADADIRVEEQKSDNPRISKLLKQASKKGSGIGQPEFIVSSAHYPGLLIVIECKADVARHRTPDFSQPVAYACDGALHYASYLSKEFDVIAIGVSGETPQEVLVSQFLCLRARFSVNPFVGDAVLSLADYYQAYITSPEKFNQDYEALLSYSQDLNEKLHKLKVKESQRSLLLSGILISLQNRAFRIGYAASRNAEELSSNLVNTIVNELRHDGIDRARIQNLRNAYAFISTHTILSRDMRELVDLISEVDDRVNGFMRTHEYFDTIGQFYIEFLRYANNDKGLGIVLTPPHITELFADLAQVNERSIVWDSCCGTGGFLISAMKRMVAATQGDSDAARRVKTTQLLGTEVQDDIYALAISNMILQGDGKSGIVLGSCFEDAERATSQNANVGLLNPPYKASAQDIEELEFVIWTADALQPGGTCIAIIPISCVLAGEGPNLELKKRLMSKHTVEAVMSMPEELFFNSDVGAITCMIVLRAHQPHPATKKTWLGYWRDDGFTKVKGKGRIDAHHRWAAIKEDWLSRYLSRETDAEHAVSAVLTPSDEWCAEAYMTTDYSNLTERAFQDELRKYLAFRVSEGV